MSEGEKMFGFGKKKTQAPVAKPATKKPVAKKVSVIAAKKTTSQVPKYKKVVAKKIVTNNVIANKIVARKIVARNVIGNKIVAKKIVTRKFVPDAQRFDTRKTAEFVTAKEIKNGGKK